MGYGGQVQGRGQGQVRGSCSGSGVRFRGLLWCRPSAVGELQSWQLLQNAALLQSTWTAYHHLSLPEFPPADRSVITHDGRDQPGFRDVWGFTPTQMCGINSPQNFSSPHQSVKQLNAPNSKIVFTVRADANSSPGLGPAEGFSAPLAPAGPSQPSL